MLELCGLDLDAATRFASRCLFMENGSIVHECGVDALSQGDAVDRLLGI